MFCLTLLQEHSRNFHQSLTSGFVGICQRFNLIGVVSGAASGHLMNDCFSQRARRKVWLARQPTKIFSKVQLSNCNLLLKQRQTPDIRFAKEYLTLA